MITLLGNNLSVSSSGSNKDFMKVRKNGMGFIAILSFLNGFKLDFTYFHKI